MSVNRCGATYDTARCTYTRGHTGPHYSQLNQFHWTAPIGHVTTRPKNAA